MPETLLLVELPAERATLAQAVLDAGATPVIDLTCGGLDSVPEGAWIRVLPGHDMPGTGPVVLATRGAPVRGRPTWLERTEPGPLPGDYAGFILRGREAGGVGSTLSGLDLLAAHGHGAILDAGLGPVAAAGAVARGAAGIVLREQLYGLPELELGAELARRVQLARDTDTRVVRGFRVAASPLSPVVRRLAAGEDPWKVSRGWFRANDADAAAWPAGQALALAAPLARRHPSLESLIGAYRRLLGARQEVVAPKTATSAPAVAPATPPPSAPVVAIVGLGVRVPGSADKDGFWDNVTRGVSCIGEVPKDRWDPERYFDPDRKAPDKSYTRIGGFVTDFAFESRRYRIPPKVAKLVDPVQQLALATVSEALDDAGLSDPESPVDRTRVAIILGNSMGGEITDDYAIRVRTPEIVAALEEVPGYAELPADSRERIAGGFAENLKASLPPITEDSMPGELSNVIAGRIANAFDLGGPNFTVDAACASSMAAIQAAVKGLQDGDYDVAVTGGVDRMMSAPSYIKFCKIGALSPDHSAPFDASANGFVMGEGAGILVLKRLEDAEKQGDRIYALIRGIGASSDGRGKGITAPNIEGQKRALRRAYADAGVDPVEVDLFECHGTSTVVGDKVEVEALSEVIGEGRRGARGPVRIGSVKSQIGHLKSAAGAVATIKTALALYRKVLPPSINFQRARDDVPLDTVPLKVQDRTEDWQADGWRRLAGVSAFGFGGTNFHVVLEEHVPRAIQPAARPPSARVETPSAGERPLPEGIWAISAPSTRVLLERLEAVEDRAPTHWRPTERVRLAAAAESPDERRQQLARIRKVLGRGGNPDLLRVRGIHYEDTPCDSKVAFLFTGQGSQYVGMGLDLAGHFEVVARTFAEADAVMAPELGRPLTDYIAGRLHSDPGEAFEALRDTEISQPATLTLDVAILRLLASYGVYPDVVAGHSLGEYGALVAAGMMDFEDALKAVSARGREMAGIVLEDPGRMAGIATSTERVEAVLAEVPGYVVAANKNCPTQTVIAGATDAVEAACEVFRSRGITVYPLPVSHAFHTRIVAPASEPLRRILTRLGIRQPRRPITTNVDSGWYPEEPEEVLDVLSRQVASPVEWTAQMERMYADGARVFVECGPKRALTGFTTSILKRRPHRAVYTNNPKTGGVRSFKDALAAMLVMGFPVEARPAGTLPDLFGTMGPRLATSEGLAAVGEARVASPYVLQVIRTTIGARTDLAPEDVDLDFELEADLGIDTVRQAEVVAQVREHFKLEREAGFLLSDHKSVRQLADYFAGRLGELTPAVDRSRPAVATQPRVPPGAPDVSAPPAVSEDVLGALAAAVARSGAQEVDADAFARALAPALQGFLTASWQAFQSATAVPSHPAPEPAAPAVVAAPPEGIVPETPRTPAPSMAPPPALEAVVCTGAAVGLPGGETVFSDENIPSILRGDNRITEVPEALQQAMVEKAIVRLHKDEHGQGTFVPVTTTEGVVRLAGQAGRFDLAEEYGLDPTFVRALGRTTQLAIAVGLEALRDAGVPLVRTFRTTTKGTRVPTGWALPPSMRDTTGILFASAFPGVDQVVQRVLTNGADEHGHYDRRFLLQILAMGHSQFAQHIGARGPNAQVNVACSSTTLAIGLAADWIRLGRCDSVLVVGADDVTGEDLVEWFGAGFVAAGAATTTANVEEAALPFDRRRHGMIMGMGAVGLVMERASAAAARGVVPLAELLASEFGNSAFHGTRLDVDHISEVFKRLVDEACAYEGIAPEAMAARAMFMSHETYTPAQGGSADAEIGALRAAFGDAADQVVVSNTKGFTGHPMGAGVEDCVALKALQYGTVPPIPNLREPDPALGDLRLSTGGAYDVDYALRFSAGFGSQLALLAWKGIARGDERVADVAARDAWLRAETGFEAVELVVEQGTLRAVAAAAPEVVAEPPAVATPEPVAPAAPPAAPAPAATGPSREEVLEHLLAVISDKTGYERDELELDYELEADLGVDTVKQAEIFASVRETYGIERDEDFVLADYPTIQSLADWLAGEVSRQPEPSPPTASVVSPEVSLRIADLPQAQAPEPPAFEDPDSVPDVQVPARPGGSYEEVLETVIRLVGDKTGYGPEDLDPDYELEADLGIDTVKQAEIFSEVRSVYGVERDEDFVLADYPTLSALATWLSQRVPSATPALPEDVTAVPEPVTADMPHPEAVEPLFVELDALAEPGADLPPVRDLPPGLPEGFALRRVTWVDQPLQDPGGLPQRVYRVLGSGERAETLRLAILERGGLLTGDPDVVVDTGGSVFSSFQHARRLLQKPPKAWITVTFVRPGDPVSGAADGGRAGLGKALGQEWEDCGSRVVQLDPRLPASRVAQLICRELAAEVGAPEVRLDPNGVRQALALEVVETPPPCALPAGQVVLVTGGGRGICARIAEEFARRSPCRLVLVGRTPAGEEPLDEAAEKARVKAELVAAGAKATPVEVRDAVAPLVKAEQIRQNLARLEEVGAKVEYRTCDLADPDAVRGLVSEVLRSHGDIHVCVHGAGVEVSRPLAEKTEADFHRVFDGKALGGLALADALPEDCIFLSMGSVAGRFGNIGQVDYSAANEAMAQVCHVRPGSLHVDWTAWDDVGMAVRGGMRTLLGERGVQMLPAAAGAALSVDLVSSGQTGEVLVSGALGGLLPSAAHPLVDAIDFDGEDWVLRRRLSLESDPWIADHSIDGTPVLPGVIGIELMAALAGAVRPGAAYRGVEDVRFDAPVKLHRGEPVDLEVRGRPLDEHSVRCTLSSQRTLKTGRVQRTVHFTGTVRTSEPGAFEPMPPAFFRSQPLEADAIYERFFHGPVFKVLSGADDVTRDGLLARAQVDQGPLGAVISSPLILEAAFQAAGLHAMVSDGLLALPHSLESLSVVGTPDASGPLVLTVHRQGEAYDVDVEQDGRVVMVVRGFRMIERGPLPEPDRFQVPEGGYSVAAFGRAVVVKAPAGVLNQQEEAGLRARGTLRRQAERIAGRVAAKRAIQALTGAAFEDIRIRNLPSGEPVVELGGQPGPALSISHSGGLAVAVARSSGRVGVDLEQVQQRHPAFTQGWFTAGERELVGEDPGRITCAWTVKEAVLKALGTGMALSPLEVEVLALSDHGTVEVALRGRAASRHLELGGGLLEVRFQRHGEAVLAEAVLAA